MNAEEAAKKQHEIYERLAPQFGYVTDASSSVPWERVPAPNKHLMIAVFEEILPLIVGTTNETTCPHTTHEQHTPKGRNLTSTSDERTSS